MPELTRFCIVVPVRRQCKHKTGRGRTSPIPTGNRPARTAPFMQKQEVQLKWFAARTIREKSYVLQLLEYEGIRHVGISDLRTLYFIQCTDAAIHRLKFELYDKLLIYRDAKNREPQPIPDNVMQTFFVMAPYHDEPVIYLPVDDPSFFEGKRKRVISGIFKGCEGIIKRIKGERRLIVKLNDRAAVATPYIPREYLEDIE